MSDAAIDLRLAAADHAAGDLPAAEAAAFARLAAAEPDLLEEAARWRAFQARLALGAPDPAHAPGEDFADQLLRRRRQERSPRAIAIPLSRWLAVATAAGLGVLIGGFALPHAAPAVGAVAWQDDGTALGAPAATARPALRLAGIDRVHTSGDDPARLAATAEHPWIGLWTRLVTVDEGTPQARRAQLVVRVVADSPAGEAHIHAGDVILSVNGVPADQEQSLAKALAAHRPGDTLTIECWCAIIERTNLHQVVVGKVFE